MELLFSGMTMTAIEPNPNPDQKPTPRCVNGVCDPDPKDLWTQSMESVTKKEEESD